MDLNRFRKYETRDDAVRNTRIRVIRGWFKMSEPIVIKYGARQYSAHWTSPASIPAAGSARSHIGVSVRFITSVHRVRHVVKPDEESARRWLCDNCLRKSKAKKLLAAALRNEGDYSDPNHPHRVRQPRMDTILKALVEVNTDRILGFTGFGVGAP